MPSSPNGAKQNSRLWVSLLVSAVMLLALFTGVYSTIVEPTLTNVVTSTRTATRSTESSIYTEKTSVYVWTSMEVKTLRTMKSRFTICSYKECKSDCTFYDSIELWELWMGADSRLVTMHNVCIHWENELEVGYYYLPARSCRSETNTYYSLSARTLTLTSTGTTTTLSRSFVEFPVTVTESHYETLPNPQKFNLQRLAVVLFIAGVGGIALATILGRPLARQPSAAFPAALPVPEPRVESRETKRTIITENKFCRYCGATIPRVSKYCEECGRSLMDTQ